MTRALSDFPTYKTVLVTGPRICWVPGHARRDPEGLRQDPQGPAAAFTLGSDLMEGGFTNVVNPMFPHRPNNYNAQQRPTKATWTLFGHTQKTITPITFGYYLGHVRNIYLKIDNKSNSLARRAVKYQQNTKQLLNKLYMHTK